MNITPTQNQPRTAPAFGALEVHLGKIPQALKAPTVGAIRKEIGEGCTLHVPVNAPTKFIRDNFFVGFDFHSTPNKIVIAISDAAKDLKSSIENKLNLVLQEVGIKYPEQIVADTGADKIFKKSSSVLITTPLSTSRYTPKSGCHIDIQKYPFQ